VSYYGHHPIAVDAVAGVHVAGTPHDLEYCYLNGPHFHAYAPAADLKFELKGGAYWYVDAYPKAYETDKRALVRINAVYEPIVYARPVITVEPPVAYVGPILEVHAVVATPSVVVEAPGAHAEVRGGLFVDVHVPRPTLEVQVGLPGIVVVDDDHHHRHRTVHVERKHKHKHKHKKHKSARKLFRRGH
jgi:hypothetical protein